MAYPTSLDTSGTLPNPSASDKTNNPSHSSLHGLENAAIIALETKLGTGSSTPASSTLLIGTGAGTSAWSALTSAQLAAVLSDETGSGAAVFANTPTLITPKIDSIQENTVGNGTTINGVLLKSSKMNGSYLTDGSVGSAALATGTPVQIVTVNYTAAATTTSAIPKDDTIPQITEGTEFMTLAITPKSATNQLAIEAKIFGAGSAVANIAAALFQDATANALAADGTVVDNAGGVYDLHLVHSMIAGTALSTTFRVRVGVDSGTYTFNGVGGSRLYGAISKSFIKITEYKV